MNNAIKKIIKKLLPSFIIKSINNCLKRINVFLNWNPWVNSYYSQEGEDILLEKIFSQKKKVFM